MLNKLSNWEDTIVALATAPGISAIGVIRLSGPGAIAIINALFPSKDLSKKASHTLHVGFIQLNGKDLDEVVVSLFKNPKSYTGEDVVEISCHGSPFVQQQILNACIAQGARLAGPGEFTQRAFLNGKLDLTQAEAVADLIASNSAASQKTALHNIRGGFSEVLKTLRANLLQFSALIELELDFSQEDLEFADRKKFYALIDQAVATTRQLLDSFSLGNVIRNGVSVAIIGKPNAGKSTLLNSLLNEDRAIVSAIAGTTRDTVEELLNIEGILFRIIDTAGIRDNSVDEIELVGIERSREKMKSADLVLYIFDVSTTTTEALESTIQEFQQQQIKFILVGNKADLKDANTQLEIPGQQIYFTASKSGLGIEDLKKALFTSVTNESLSSETTIISNARHHAALQQVQASLLVIREGLDNKIPGDLLALDIRHCLHYISEITGDITNETVLDLIFGQFCIGK